jgi:type II secretory pathway pseudopilin PulG
LRSGAYGQEQNKGLRALTLGQYDARQQALDTLQGLQSTYLQGQDTARGQIGTALTDAQKRASDLVNAGQLGGAYKPPATSTNPYMPPTAAPNMGMPQITRGSNAGPSAAAIFGGNQGRQLFQAPKPPKPPAAPGLKTRFF